MATLSFRGLEKTYGSTRVLARVDLEVQSGEYVVLVGPSGCGKSTLLRCIAGLEEITAGELQIAGRRVNEVAPRDRDVAMVFQSYALYPHMTVRENMGFPLRIRKRPTVEIDQAVQEAAQLLDLSALLERKPAQLSGGQRQRVAMGRAIVRRPKVFLFDEPLSNLDATLRHHMRVELKRLHRRLGATIVHVTHDQVEALTLADRIVVLHRGVVQQVGSPAELYDRPANTFVAGFVGSPSMNLLPVHARRDGGEGVVVEGTGLQLPVRPPAGRSSLLLGFRPSETALARDESSPATVDVIEPMGGEGMVHVLAGKTSLVALVREPIGLQPGDPVAVRPSVVHCFDAETTSRLPEV
jgi:multiple sugar transport system ATP-binding protein